MSSELQQLSGAFVASLVRKNSKIKEDRALAIAESAQMFYKRTVEDLELEVKQLKRDRDAMLDLSPTTADSLIMASDFDAKKFTEKDIELGVKIRTLEIKLEIARDPYKTLFGW